MVLWSSNLFILSLKFSFTAFTSSFFSFKVPQKSFLHHSHIFVHNFYLQLFCGYRFLSQLEWDSSSEIYNEFIWGFVFVHHLDITDCKSSFLMEFPTFYFYYAARLWLCFHLFLLHSIQNGFIECENNFCCCLIQWEKIVMVEIFFFHLVKHKFCKFKNLIFHLVFFKIKTKLPSEIMVTRNLLVCKGSIQD